MCRFQLNFDYVAIIPHLPTKSMIKAILIYYFEFNNWNVHKMGLFCSFISVAQLLQLV